MIFWKALNQKYGDIRFVWDIVIQFHHIRTDATCFYPYKLDRNLYINNEEASLLRYCTDMVCIDIGHSGAVTDCEWAAYMPRLRYLIIGETGISDLSPLADCKELVYLEIFTIPVTDYSPLVGCTALEDLNLGKTYCDLTPIAQMTWLKNLWWCGAYPGPAQHPGHGDPARGFAQHHHQFLTGASHSQRLAEAGQLLRHAGLYGNVLFDLKEERKFRIWIHGS